MVRIISLNKFIENRNKFIFRYPNERKFRLEQNSFCATPTIAGTNVRDFLCSNPYLTKRVSCRFKSTATNITLSSSKQSPSPRSKSKWLKIFKTTVTEITDSSSTVKRESVEVFRKKNLTNFIRNATNDTSSSSKMPILHEKPIILTPGEINFDLTNNKELAANLKRSFQDFLAKSVSKPMPTIEEESPSLKNVDPIIISPPLETETDLQKNYDKPNELKTFKYHAPLERNLRAYINTCISVDMTEHAFKVFNQYRKNGINGKKISEKWNPELYMELMAKYASRRNWDKVKQMFSMMLEDKSAITPQVYMIMLDCLGRNQGNNKLIQKCIQKAAEEGISINDIMDKSVFRSDQRTYVLEAIRRHSPNFTPAYSAPNLSYNNELLNFMNKDIRPIEELPYNTINASVNCEISNAKKGFTADELQKYADEQFRIESNCQLLVKNITMLNSTVDTEVSKKREILDKLFNRWREDISTTIQKKMHIAYHRMKTVSDNKMNIYPYLKLLTPEECTEILLDELKCLLRGSEAYAPSVISIYQTIGNAVMKKYQVKLANQLGVNEKILNLHKTYREILSSGECSENPRQLWQRIIHHSRGDGPCLQQINNLWPWSFKTVVGRTLFKVISECLKIDANLLQPSKGQNIVLAIYSVFRNRDLKSREEIRLHPTLVTLFRESNQESIHFNANEVPMLCPCVPWTSIDSGGYLMSEVNLIRLSPECNKQVKMIRDAPPQQMYPTFDTLNSLGSVPWRINTRILDLAIKIFNLGGNEELNVPLTPDNMLTDEQLRYRGVTRADLVNERSSVGARYVQNQQDLLSLYSDTLYKLSLANHFRNRPFWLPHNLDFRGRTYPISPHLTHLSSDLTRSMLMFHQKKPLGENGLNWLKLHCINLTGLKKRESVEDRLIYFESIMDDILDSADNPLDGRKWWLNSDDPWQTLAACMEIADALRSPDPKSFMSSFPIHQDGSCNGLQHYAALGRDVEGAASVNLSPAECPQDVYSTIMNRVENIRKRDAENGNQIAIELDGLIKRKIVKQTVMTTVYGVTEYGAKLQVKKQLKNINFNHKLTDQASVYIVKAIFESLSETFSSAREIQDWFTLCASYIAKHHGAHVKWVSPIGLPIVQPYTQGFKYNSNVELTTLNSTTDTINTMKQKNAFSPNFIHSLDSTHMMLTSLNCERSGLTFVSVHDCFWTHASTVHTMNRICRDQFVLLHSQPILEKLGDSFCQQYGTSVPKKIIKKTKKKEDSDEVKDSNNKIVEFDDKKRKHLFQSIPEKGQFDLKKVLESVYFFS